MTNKCIYCIDEEGNSIELLENITSDEDGNESVNYYYCPCCGIEWSKQNE